MMPHTSTSPDPVSNSTCLEMNMGGKKAVVKGERLVLVKTNIRGGPYRIIRGGGLTQACAGSVIISIFILITVN